MIPLIMCVGVATMLFPLVHGLTVEELPWWIAVVYAEFYLAQLFLIRGPPGTGPSLILASLLLPLALPFMVNLFGEQVVIRLVLGGWMICHGGLRVLVCLFKLLPVTTSPARLLLLVTGIISITLGHILIAFTPTYGVTFVVIVCIADLLSVGVAGVLLSNRTRGRHHPRMDANGAA